MRTSFLIPLLAVLLFAASPCLALWSIARVSPDDAKKMGLEIRSKPLGRDQVQVELEFKLEGQLKNIDGVELRTAIGENAPKTSPLPEDRSKQGRVIVTFTANRDLLGKLSLGVRVPELDGGSIYELRLKDFIDLKKER